VMRPLRHLAAQGTIELDVVPCSREGRLDPGAVARALGAGARLVALTHASNVTGTIMPVTEVAALCRERGLCSSSTPPRPPGPSPSTSAAGASTCWRSPGTRASSAHRHRRPLYPGGHRGPPLHPRGTGSNSEQEEQPDFLPDRLESGTMTQWGSPGCRGPGLHPGTGVERIRAEEVALTALLLEGLAAIPGVEVHGPGAPPT